VATAKQKFTSKDCSLGKTVEEKSKINMNIRGEDREKKGVDIDAGEALNQLKSLDASNVAAEYIAPPATYFQNEGIPVASISSHQSRASTTYSSLSDEGGDDDDVMLSDATAAAVGAASDNRNNNAGTAPRKGFTRPASHDDSLDGKIPPNGVSGGTFASSSSATTSEGTKDGTSPGNWGWFEDVHGHESATPAMTNDKKSKKKKKGGLLDVGGELMKNMLQAIVEPHRKETSAMAVTAPTYVLEESLSNQKLWKQTAGNRPPQPVEERAFFEQMWSHNFTRSKVKYEIPVEVLTASTPISISPFNDDGFIGEDGAQGGNHLSNYNLAGPFDMNGSEEHGAAAAAEVKAAQADVAEATLDHHMRSRNGAVDMYFDPNRPKEYNHYNLKTLGPHQHHHTMVNKKVKGAGEENDLVVVVRGDNVFGTTVSKSFGRRDHEGNACDGIDTVSISIASYRVVESKKHGKYAQYLVIFCDGDFRNTVGVWKRYSNFSELSRKVSPHGHSESCRAAVTGLSPPSVTDDHEAEILPNAMTSWKLLKKRQRWYRCLDAGYLSLKVFLLERFLHDILFESSHPQILRDFVGIRSSEASKLNTKG